MKLREETERIQEKFGEYCRTGMEPDIPGVTPGRLHHYRRLVYNVVRNSLDSAFPISVAAFGEEQWDFLVQDFFSGGIPQTPQIWRLPFEFYRYHTTRETGKRIIKPYLDDLLYFEWMEIEVHNMPDRPFPDFITNGNLLEDRLVLNPEYEIIRMEYPVHKHSLEEALELKGDHFALIFRAPDTGYVHFLDLPALNIYILTLIAEEDVPVRDLQGQIARISGIESGRYMDEALEKFLGDLLRRKLILGFRSR